MNGLRLLLRRARRKPVAAATGLARDYAVYIGMTIFVVMLVLLKWPLTLLDRVMGWSVRERIIRGLARLSRA